MVDLSPLLEKIIELLGYAKELNDAYEEEDGVRFYLPCRGGSICCELEVLGDENQQEKTEYLLLHIKLWPISSQSEQKVFDLANIDNTERYEEKIQEELLWSSLVIQNDVPGMRYPGFRRMEMLDPKLEFIDQDHDRLVTIFGAMLSEVKELFPRLVAYHQGRKEIYGHMILTESASPGLH